MDEVNIAVEEVKKIIRHCIIPMLPSELELPNSFDGYQNLYYQTNENIAEYLNLVDISNSENALCVAGSGDQAFSLISKGINNIQLFDVNKFTEYFILGLKRTMIVKYNYSDYINLFNKLISPMTMPNEVEEILSDVLLTMDEPYKTFWQSILNFNFKYLEEINVKANFMYGLNVNAGLKIIPTFCSYLENEENYNKLKNNLGKANINFKYCNGLELTKNFNNKFDLILLSNILDYAYIYWGSNWSMQNLNNYINDLQNILKDKGIIFLHYIFCINKPFHQSDFYKPYLDFDNETYNLKYNHQMLLVRK